MNDKTGKAIAAAISDLAKAVEHLAVTQLPQRFIIGGGGGSGSATITGGGGVGGSPGGIHPRTGGGGGGGPGAAALTIVGEAGPEYFSFSSDAIRRSA